ncbi:MAG: TIGR00282 family metallophosphoesterase [Fusobacterium sp. JB021]|nr:TIGR00282 family metallophosphoesterase [Fusobacterium sp. JB020]MDP0494455.1 TIGR00282 family metallophosphoesterase [Fusobacterium sp. JB021]MDP0506808.1 TIGR00282 family metallophosphoesterase [Fusobacterium sp. JB019]
MRVLVVGDIVGRPGRKTFEEYVKKFKEKYDFIIANGENSAAGFGITSKIAEEFYALGVDVITSGNHIWDKKDIYTYLEGNNRLLRPLNYPKGVPGKGYTVVKSKSGINVGVVSLQGRVFMPPTDCPFTRFSEVIDEIREKCKIIIVDFHAEATSEKIAMSRYFDGKISVLYGTHTHVQTADEKILLEGTGYISDVGMTGSDNGVIGMDAKSIIPKFLECLPQRFEIATGKERLNGLEIEIDEETGECTSIERINMSLSQIEIF